MNGYSPQCEFIPSFISDKADDRIEFFTIGAGAAGSMYKGHAETAAAMGLSSMVATTTIDTLVQQIGWVPEFVKIDVEGAESKVLQGASQLALAQKTWFMVEMHSPPELPMIENARLILEWANNARYQVWYMRDAVLLDKPEVIASRGKCHLLFMPEGTPYPDTLRAIPQRSFLPKSV